jgi:hypothetical protein
VLALVGRQKRMSLGASYQQDVLHGDPAAGRDIRQSLRGKLAELVTRS